MTTKTENTTTTTTTPQTIIEVRGLHVGFRTPSGHVRAVRGVDLDVRAGETLGIVGESGSGKTVTALSLLGEVRRPGRVESGGVRFRGRELFAMAEAERAALRGAKISMVFQDPMNSLDPVMKVGRQLEETIRLHRPGLARREVRERALDLMRLVGIPGPERRFHDHPFAFSGGMRQRMMIALAMSGDPEVLVADEPTTALDVTVQAQVLEVFARLNRELGTAIVLVTHNFGVVARLCDRVVVMYGGRIVERAGVPEVFTDARHPYTRGLIACVPSMTTPLDRRLPVIDAEALAAEAEPHAGGGADGVGSPTGSAAGGDAAAAAREPEPAGRTPPPAGAVAAFGGGVGGPPGADGDAVGATLSPPGRQDDANSLPGADGPAGTLASGEGDAARGATPPRARRARPGGAAAAPPVLSGSGLTRHHRVRGGLLRGASAGVVRSVDGVDVHVARGESLGIVGESGCGKSSLARLLVRADEPTAGRVVAESEDVTNLSGRQLARFRRSVQMIFQDPLASLNPRLTIGALLEEPLIIHGLEPDRAARRARCAELLRAVGLPTDILDRRPRQFSGGQLQRIAIARALAVDPEVLICDEPVSSLDVSLQAQVVNLLDELQADRGLAYVFISHDVSLVRYFTDRVGVMYLGTMVETGPTLPVLDAPLHPYTRSLIDSVPEPNAETAVRRSEPAPVLAGELPSPLDPPGGCRFHPRCPIGPAFRDRKAEGRERCVTEPPPLREVGPGRHSACHFAEELLAGERAEGATPA
ncbi:dipeptide ABC transporter ATP-binding protein [Streptomyces sp. 6N223]|uniref:dipeptide ABC transporter ATP-binding protein n=1 Tax=Streptomyces sp. 6N223 TaxID=3457412 RepID=UPI003FD05727